MEQYQKFCWEELVNRSIKRRKKLKITQKRLSLIANVSTPTISKFENNDHNIKLSSALAVLRALGV
jgi:predicted transcriptional regulator